MTVRVGVIGAEEVIRAVMELGSEFPSLELLSIPYQNEEETITLVEQYQDRVDEIVFAGPVPYYLALDRLELRLPVLYIRPIGANLLRALFDLAYHQDIDLTRISIDTLGRLVVEETYTELGLASDNVYTKEYAGPVVAKDLVPFHHNLWKQGKTSAALTGLRSASIQLRDLGVRVYWITPVKAAIRETLQLAVLEGNRLRSQAMQIVIGICHMDGFREIVQQANSEYEAQRVKLALHDLLNDYGEQTQAWVQEIGGDEFAIFMTRGVLEQATDYYRTWSLTDSIRQELPITTSWGIGLGRTAREAGENARSALVLAKQNGGDCAFVVSQDGEALGPLGSDHKLQFTFRTEDEHILKLAKRTHLSVSTLSKVDSLLRTLGRKTVTAKELAQWLNIGPRSARRLLSNLDKKGLATVVGEEQSADRGRPRAVYSIKLK